MHLPQRTVPTRAFLKKAYSFIRYYPLRRKDPSHMLLETLRKLENLVDSVKDSSELEPLSEEIKGVIKHPRPEELFQIEVVDEPNKFIIYKPLKFFPDDRYADKIVYLYDLLYIP